MNSVVGTILSCICLINLPTAIKISPTGSVPTILVHQKIVMNYISIVVDPSKITYEFCRPQKVGFKVETKHLGCLENMGTEVIFR
jgi:hypothetical protein